MSDPEPLTSGGAGHHSVVIVGLDGASFDYIGPLAATGRLPNLRGLMESGVSACLRSTYPPISAPAWITFMTGERPARHGVFEFWKTDLSRYNPLAGEQLVSSTSYAGKTLFDVIGAQGRVAALRVPVTYPAWPIEGQMVSGYPAPWGAEGSVYPPQRRDLIRRPRHGKSGWLTRHRGSQEEMRLSMFREQLGLTRDLALAALREGPYALFMTVFNQLDAAGHHFPRHADPAYPSYDPRLSPRYAGVITEFHERLDGALGEILANVDHDTLVIIMSDHGMGPRSTQYFHTNAWLAEQGLLTPRRRGSSVRSSLSRLTNFLNENLPIRQELRRVLPRRLKATATGLMFNFGGVHWEQTQAYRVRMLAPIEGIEINLKGRQPLGTVHPGPEYERLRALLLQRLQEARDPATGSPIVAAAYRREELYDGPYLEQAPDIIFELQGLYEGGVAVRPPVVGPIPPSFLTMRSGNHTMSGIFIARGPFVRCRAELGDIRLEDLAPTIVHYLGMPVPSNMDGRVVTEAFEPSFASRPVIRGPAVVARGSQGSFSAAEEEAMRDQLRGLGYL